MRYLALFLMTLCSYQFAYGQTQLNKQKARLQKKIKDKQERAPFLSTQVKKPTKSLSLIGQLNTNGYCAGLQFEKKKNKHFRSCTISFSEIKSDKEEKFKPTNLEIKPFGKPKPYIYGKQHSLYNLNITTGRRTVLFNGLLAPSIDISWHYYGGISFGLLKPYSLKLKYHQPQTATDIKEEIYTPSNADYFLDKSIIYSRSNFKQSLNQTKFIPGLLLGTSFAAEIGKHPAFIKRISAGGQFTAYSNTMNLLIRENEKAFFYNAFIGIAVGKRW